jgi:general secretion pathway protein G
MERSNALSPEQRRTKRRTEDGFTLIELMTVVAIMGVLIAIALPNYRVAIIQSKEAVLKEDLYRLRSLLDTYQSDRGQYPESLDELVKAKYLREIPMDPMTGTREWETVLEESDSNDPSKTPGIYDVKSNSDAISLNGVPYNTW